VFYGRSVAAAAVASHEVGHAVQHATAYNWLMLRSRLVPAVSATSRYLPFILIGGILTLNIFPQLLLIGIILFAMTTLFSFVTLPVEFDASRRALVWLKRTNITGGGEQQQMAATALRWAASTYVMSAISSLATLLYYVMIFLGRRD
jgi:Zn-dependent membrane protease YugP